MTLAERLAEKWQEYFDAPEQWKESEQARWWINAITDELDAHMGGEQTYSSRWLREQAITTPSNSVTSESNGGETEE